MEFLKTLNFIDKDKYYYYYDNGIFRLEYYCNKWYLYDNNNKKSDIIYNIEDFINTNKYKLEKSKLMVEKNDEFIEKLIKMIGEFTFCTKFMIGWNICNSKIKLKITIDKFSNIDDKTIKIQHTYNNNISNNISGEELIKFVTDNIDMILYKDPIENELQLNEMKLNKLKLNYFEVNDNNYDDIKLNKVNIDEIKKTLFIKLTKARKISYQSCLPYDDNKKKLEKLYGVDLDL
jgi:hypothetical protein|uniref:Uncharacterized protein n=1 Tax=viral metagenome TaxID=1070528 RepID=A0A6C0AM47_9ZZZZ